PLTVEVVPNSIYQFIEWWGTPIGDIIVSCVPTNAPKIAVLSGTNSLDNPGLVFIGVTNVGKTISADLMVTNIGSTNLILTNVTITGPFTISNPPPANLSLPTPGSRQLTIQFSPNTTGEFHGVLTITNNDVYGTPFQVE